MPHFSRRSLESLEGLDERLIELAHIVIQSVDFVVLEGQRSMARQKRLVEDGLSKTLESRHLVGKAFDMAPFPIPDDWAPPRFILLGGFFLATAKANDIPLRWGGDWRGNFQMNGWADYGHIEIPKGDD